MDRLRNDLVDIGYVAYATLFDGLLSNDRKLLDIYEEATFFLQRVFIPMAVNPAEAPRNSSTPSDRLK